MPPGVNLATSYESVPTYSDDSSFFSNNDDSDDDEPVYIGSSSRPQLPPYFAHSFISKSLPLGGPRCGIASRGLGPPPRSQSAHQYQARVHKAVSQNPPRAQPANAQPSEPPLSPPLSPSFRTGPTSSTLPQTLASHNRQTINIDENRHDCDDRGHGKGSDSCFGSFQQDDKPDSKTNANPGCTRRLPERCAKPQIRQPSPTDSDELQDCHRAQLRKLRQRKDKADQRFLAAARELLADNPQLDHLHSLFEEMRKAHHLCLEVEQHLEDVVDEPHHGQEDLESREGIFYGTNIRALGSAPPSDGNDQDHSDTSQDYALRGITGELPDQPVHPQYEELREVFRQLELARELLANTQMKRHALYTRKTQPLMEDTLTLMEENYGDVGKKRALEMRSIPLITGDDAEQLKAYDELEQAAKKDIEIYTEKFGILHHKCRTSGVMPSSSYFQQEGFGLDSFHQEEIVLGPGPSQCDSTPMTLAHPVFPLLLCNPTRFVHRFPQTAQQFLRATVQLPPEAPARKKLIEDAAREVNMHALLINVDLGDKNEYINRWLLDKLHNSPMEAELLRTIFQSKLNIINMDRWQEDVLHFWWRDETDRTPIKSQPPTEPTSRNSDASIIDETPKFAGFNTFSYSDSGQLDTIRNWNLDNEWL